VRVLSCTGARLTPWTPAQLARYRDERAAIIATQRIPHEDEIGRAKRPPEPRTITDRYRLDREAARNKPERSAVWKTYAIALYQEIADRIERGSWPA
jgi:hypothetical protein